MRDERRREELREGAPGERNEAIRLIFLRGGKDKEKKKKGC